jgi:hypothetical protein
MRRILTWLGVGAALAVVAAGCGSAAASSSSTSASQSFSQPAKPSVAPKKLVAEMVLHDGDLHGFQVLSAGGEKLNEQYPPPHMPHRAELVRLVRKSWIASAHSIVGDRYGNKIVSDVNLFRTVPEAAAVTAAEREWTAPSDKVTRLAVPEGSPAGARFNEQVQDGKREFSIDWREGRVIAYVAIVLPAKTPLSSRARVDIAIMLHVASDRLADRVAHPSGQVLAVSA